MGSLQPATKIPEDSLHIAARAFQGVPLSEVPEEFLKGREF